MNPKPQDRIQYLYGQNKYGDWLYKYGTFIREDRDSNVIPGIGPQRPAKYALVQFDDYRGMSRVLLTDLIIVYEDKVENV